MKQERRKFPGSRRRGTLSLGFSTHVWKRKISSKDLAVSKCRRQAGDDAAEKRKTVATHRRGSWGRVPPTSVLRGHCGALSL